MVVATAERESTMIRLICKGNAREAADSAMLRNVPFQFDREVDSGRQSVGTCPDGYISSVLSWFCERSILVDGFGYPIGTLLWYQSPDWIAPKAS